MNESCTVPIAIKGDSPTSVNAAGGVQGRVEGSFSLGLEIA